MLLQHLVRTTKRPLCFSEDELELNLLPIAGLDQYDVRFGHEWLQLLEPNSEDGAIAAKRRCLKLQIATDILAHVCFEVVVQTLAFALLAGMGVDPGHLSET